MSTSPGCASAAIRVTAWTATPRTLPAWRSTSPEWMPARISSARRTVEEGQEAVARGRDLQAAEAVELAPHAIAVACEDFLPRSIAQPHSHVRRANDVRHEQRGDDALSGFRRFSPAAHAGELDGHVRLVADDPRQVPGGMSKASPAHTMRRAPPSISISTWPAKATP
jgi:hypothetical protein